MDVAERIRSTIAETAFDSDGSKFHSTVSIGLAAFPDHGRTLDAVIARADQAMYHAKKAGRNRTECYGPESFDVSPEPA
jgi:diguanylate cyclase (GGDEF)-like protein